MLLDPCLLLLDVLNRYPFPCKSPEKVNDVVPSEMRSPEKTDPNTLHVLMYMFPRQFGLHNVFTSILDTRETVQPFKDYTVREDEIQARLRKDPKIKVPKRLRSEALRLAQKLQTLHQRCPYDALLEYHCELQVSSHSLFHVYLLTHGRQRPFLDHLVRPARRRPRALRDSELRSLCHVRLQTQLSLNPHHLSHDLNV